MKKTFAILIFTLLLYAVNAQNTSGITGIRDTSYNITAEYSKLLNNYPGIKIAKEASSSFILEEKNIAYCTTKERELKLDMFYPAEKNNKKRIAVVFIHGGGWRSGNKAMHYPLLQQLALLGYVCITPAYRLSTEALYPAAVYDIKTVIRWVRKNAGKYNIDSNKIVVAGHSAGGELAAFIGATSGMPVFEGDGCYKEVTSMVNAVIDLDGTLAFIHPESGEGDDSKRTSAATHWFGYSKTENPELWKQAAPLTHAGKHSPPFQFINSSVARMHAGREDFISILSKHNIYSEVKTFEGSPHSFILFHPWFDTTVAYMDKFLQKVFPAGGKNKKLHKAAKKRSTGLTGFRATASSIALQSGISKNFIYSKRDNSLK
jgi:pectinesterase